MVDFFFCERMSPDAADTVFLRNSAIVGLTIRHAYTAAQ
jgi:hypothetical protein